MSERAAAKTTPVRPYRLSASRAVGRRIGILGPSYNLERVSYLIPTDHHHYVRLSRVPVPRRVVSSFLDQTPVVVGGRVDLVHTFNQLPANKRFVVTSEMELPRYLGRPSPWQLAIGHRVLGSKRCRGIWPLSEAGAAYIRRRFERGGRADLCAKITVFRGALPSDPLPVVEASPDRALRLLFVGGDGLRKGLGAVLAACATLRRGGIEVELTIVGHPTAGTYVVPGERFETEPLRKMMAEEAWITHHPSVPNATVRSLMREHDIFVLPTMDESLGWVVAEAALCGTPAITTNIFALPEMVRDGETGWTIDVPRDEDGRWVYIGRADAREAWEEVQQVIVRRLVDILSEVAGKRDVIHARALAARAYIERLYGIEQARARLEALYDSALSDAQETSRRMR